MSDEKKLEKGTSGDDKVLRMGTASIPRLITEFAIPSVVGMLINGSYAIIDSVFLGHAVGEIGLSAMTVANPIMIVFMAIAMLIGNGGNALAALRLGEGKRDEAERALGNVVSLSLVAAVIVLVIGWNPALVSWVLDLASATPEVRPYAQTFIQILCAGFILQCIGLGVNNFIRTCGAPNRALGTMVIGRWARWPSMRCSCWRSVGGSWAAPWPRCSAGPARVWRCCSTSACAATFPCGCACPPCA